MVAHAKITIKTIPCGLASASYVCSWTIATFTFYDASEIVTSLKDMSERRTPVQNISHRDFVELILCSETGLYELIMNYRACSAKRARQTRYDATIHRRQTFIIS